LGTESVGGGEPSGKTGKVAKKIVIVRVKKKLGHTFKNQRGNQKKRLKRGLGDNLWNFSGEKKST